MTRIVFVDRDGTLIEEPADFQIDAYAKLRLVREVIPAMLQLRDAGFEFVLISNQDGLGTEAYPQADFDGPHALMQQIFASQGIHFREELIDTSFPHENKPTRKPGLGLVQHYLRDRGIDLDGSAMVGDRPSDMEFAANLGIRGFQLKTDQFGGEWDWPGIAHALADAPRTATVERNTRETRIQVSVDLDRSAEPAISTGIGFFDHMLEQIGKHGGFALNLTCAGDLQIDEHHTVEDCGLALGQALRQALDDKRGIGRYGRAITGIDADGQTSAPALAASMPIDLTLPMDETLARAVLDCSGRAYFVFDGEFPRASVGGMATEMVPHFFRSLCDAAGFNLHLAVRGQNTHHMVEACFKAVARALRQAITRQGRELPSTKGLL